MVVAKEAYNLDSSDQTAEFRLKEILVALGTFCHSGERPQLAVEHFKESISSATQSNKFKKLNVKAYYFLTLISYKAGDKNVASMYFNEGKKYFCGSPIERNYVSLETLIEGEKEEGVVHRIISGKAFGFIRTEGQTRKEIFLHMNNIEPPISIVEFDRLVGQRVTFLYTEAMKNGKLQLEASFVEILGLPDEYMEGTFKCAIEDKGFGFVTCDGEDHFVHYSNFNPPVSKGYFESLNGRKLAFLLEENPKQTGKLHATNVRIL